MLVRFCVDSCMRVVDGALMVEHGVCNSVRLVDGLHLDIPAGRKGRVSKSEGAPKLL